jgi:hypothetical protein
VKRSRSWATRWRQARDDEASEAGRHFPTSACRAHGDRMRCGRN